MKRNSSKTAENSAKRRGGFTLVELVVVIAVLAILAGVGAVAYRGYINHAKKAGDLELLGAVNDAFSSACVEYDIDRSVLPTGGAKIRSSDSKHIEGIYSVNLCAVSDPLSFNIWDIDSEFLYVFEPNNEIAMQYYTTDQILFDGNEHMFVFSEKSNLGSGYGGTSFADKSAEDMSQPTRWGNALIESLLTYGDGDRAGLSKSLKEHINGTQDEKVNALVDGLKDSPYSWLAGSDPDATKKQLKELLDGKITNTTNPSYTEVMNGLVMGLVQNAVKEDNLAAYERGDFSSRKNSLPLMMAEMTAYYNSDYASQTFKDKYNELFQIGNNKDGKPYTGGISATQLTNLMGLGKKYWTNDDGWADYQKSGKAKTDLDLYIQAMKDFSSEDNSKNVDLSNPDMFADFLKTWQPQSTEEP